MKEGGRPLVPMHSEACGVSEGERNQDKGKVDEHPEDYLRF